jgi:hypothetical protein
MAEHADLGARARVAGAGLDLDHALVNQEPGQKSAIMKLGCERDRKICVLGLAETLRDTTAAVTRVEVRAESVIRRITRPSRDRRSRGRIDALDDAVDDLCRRGPEVAHWRARSASRTLPVMTCLAVCAATRPNSNGGTSRSSLPTSASLSIRLASASDSHRFDRLDDGLHAPAGSRPCQR